MTIFLAVEYSSCFISVINLDLYVRCLDALVSRSPSRGLNNVQNNVQTCMFMNHSRI